jgi:hypothetical protein
LSRVINLQSSGKERTQYQRAIILALRELMIKTEINADTYDLAAFIVIMLKAIDQSIDQSVTAWEKRGYWIKADRFRQEWHWAELLGARMEVALKSDDWVDAGTVSALILSKLSKVEVPKRHGLGTPWVGAWEKLSKP